MKKFRFPLKTVAVLRAFQQEKSREIFASAVQAFVVTEDHLTRVRTELSQLEIVMNNGRRETFRPAEEASFWDAYRRVCAEEGTVEKAMIEARILMEKRRQEYLEAHRAVKVVEKLEQKARSTHQQAVALASQAEMDELAGIRAARRGSVVTATSS